MEQFIQQQIDQFAAYFRRQVESISAIEAPAKLLYDKLLYMSLLDALSKCVYPRRSNRDRMVSFILRFSQWQDAQRISLTHLVQLLRKAPDPSFENVRRFALDKYAAWDIHKGAHCSISTDPTYDEIKKLWPTPSEHRFPLEDVSLDSIQHCQLIYSFRNSLVHELRTPGHGMQFGGEPYPFYHKVSTITDAEDIIDTVELVYPSEFLKSLSLQCIDALTIYLKSNELNPYDSYKFGTYWLAQLND